MFKPTIHECQVAEGDEVYTFYVREPSGREVLQQAQKQRKDAPALDNAKELFSRYVVEQDGTPISAAKVDELLDMRLTAMHKVSEAVQEKIGLKELTEKKVLTPSELFLFRLALAMGRTVDELLDSITYRELMGWSAYYQAEPWGEWRADVRSAQIATILANSNRDPKKHPEAYKLDEFMLFKPSEQTKPASDGAKIAPAVTAWLFQKSGARMKAN